MPLIETVTYADMVNPDEVKECCDYIRFLNRSTGKVRTGIGAGREDVNVSCRGGHRVEIKGVARTKWIPELTHVEAFRQWALLSIREELRKRIPREDWKMGVLELDPKQFRFDYQPIQEAIERNEKLYAVNLPCFGGLLSHFAQPTKPFYDEFTNRLKVIACIEKPNMATSEDINEVVGKDIFDKLQKLFNAKDNDAQIIFWSPEADLETALETIEERCLWTFDGIPNETRKSFEDGTTIFERVLPGADRMYPDTDSAPIPLENTYIESLRDRVPDEVHDRYNQLVQWGVPTTVFYFLFTHNYYPTIKKIADELGLNPKYTALFFGQTLKKMQGKYQKRHFDPQNLFNLFSFLKQENIDTAIAPKMLEEMFKNPQNDFKTILKTLNYKKISKEDILKQQKAIEQTFVPKRKKTSAQDKVNFVMGTLRPMSMGNMDLRELVKGIR
jgi:glutamyl-tRNA(Gln) amidotransferase subunit E